MKYTDYNTSIKLIHLGYDFNDCSLVGFLSNGANGNKTISNVSIISDDSIREELNNLLKVCNTKLMPVFTFHDMIIILRKLYGDDRDGFTSCITRIFQGYLDEMCSILREIEIKIVKK